MVAQWKPSSTAFVLVLVLVLDLILDLDLDLILDRETASSSTSTGETPEYEYDQKTLQKAAYTIQSGVFQLDSQVQSLLLAQLGRLNVIDHFKTQSISWTKLRQTIDIAIDDRRNPWIASQRPSLAQQTDQPTFCRLNGSVLDGR